MNKQQNVKLIHMNDYYQNSQFNQNINSELMQQYNLQQQQCNIQQIQQEQQNNVRYTIPQQQNDNMEYENEIQPEMEQEFNQAYIGTNKTPSQTQSYQYFDINQTQQLLQYHVTSGSADTLNFQQDPRVVQSCKDLNENNNESALPTVFTLKKKLSKKQQVGQQSSHQQLNQQEIFEFGQVGSQLKKEEYNDEFNEEYKSEKKQSPLKQRKNIQKEKKQQQQYIMNQVKVNSSCQLSQHSLSNSTSQLTSSSSSSSSLHQQIEDGTNNHINGQKSDYNFSLVPLTKTIWSKLSEAGFGDCHVELSIERESAADNRFIQFQYWRPCSQYTIDQTNQIARFMVEPNFQVRTADFNSCIQVYKNYPEKSIQRWGHVLDLYQQWTSILFNEADYFFKKLNQHLTLKKYFEEKMEIFMQEALKKVNMFLLDESGSSKKTLFCYSLRKLNEEYKDIGSIQYGYSRGLIEVFGPDPQETRLYLQRYGLNYFFDQKSRVERYIHDFEYIQQGGQIYDRVNIITLDKIEIELKVSNQYIYYDFFSDPLAKEVFGNFSECARLVRKFCGCKIEIFELDPIQQNKLQVERHIYKPIYEKEKYLTFDAQLLSLYYKNDVKKFKNGLSSQQQQSSNKYIGEDEENIEEQQYQQNSFNNNIEFGYNPFEDNNQQEKKEEEMQFNFSFENN